MFEIPVETGYKPASALISDMRNLLEGQDHPVELGQGECGYPSSEHRTSWKGRGPWGENIQAKWLLRRFLTDLSLDIPVTVYFALREPSETNRVNAKGLLRYATWQPKPAYLALQHLTSTFDERLMKPKKTQAVWEFEDEGSFSGIRGENLDRHEAPFSDAEAPYPIQIIGLTGSGGNAVAYYAPWRMQEYVKPAKVNVRIKSISIINPVLVDLLTGIVYRVQTLEVGHDLAIGGIPLADYPIAVVPRRIVPMNKCSTTSHGPTTGEEFRSLQLTRLSKDKQMIENETFLGRCVAASLWYARIGLHSKRGKSCLNLGKIRQ